MPRYEPSLATKFNFLQDGNVLPSASLTNAGDAVLSGLAQLGAYQTRTDRAFVSLFDATHQYIIAEAAPFMRIAPELASDSLTSPLALRGSAIPRHQGTCDHVLYLSPSTETDDAAELPLSFVPNLVTDARFATRPYCQFGEAGQFYAGVPIRTRRGINIGAYCVMSQTMPEGWNDDSTRHLRDVSHAIMEHLENCRSMNTSRVHERMNRGLGSFIEGKATITGWQTSLNQDNFQESVGMEGALNVKQQQMEQQKQATLEEDELAEVAQSAALTENPTAKWSSVQNEAQHASDAPSLPSSRTSIRRPATPVASDANYDDARNTDTDEDESKLVFSKAANIIRESYEVEGCVFMEVSVGAYALSSEPDPDPNESAGNASPSTSGDDHQSAEEPRPDLLCDMLGFSTTDTSSIDGIGPAPSTVGKLPSRFLAKLLRRYPEGKIFNFDASGELQSTDSSSDDDDRVRSRPANAAGDAGVNGSAGHEPQEKRRHGRFSRNKEGTLIHQAFPSARSVAFIPVRDLKRDRWLAGGFIYTLNPARIFSVEGELSFLRAFEKAIIAELLELERVLVDRARSDALGSLSHELRSPLHGIILGAELLSDTELSGFQGNIAHVIETCCRTLLDTIDHLLDHSKVNSFQRKLKEESALPGNAPARHRKRMDSKHLDKKLHANIRLDGIVEEVAQSIFAGFNFQHKSIQQLSHQPKSPLNDIAGYTKLDFMQAVEQLSPGQDSGVGTEGFELDVVSVYLCIDPKCNWMFYMQPGAIRRIFMNLFGNSLKYTTSGHIRVSLTQETPKSGRLAAGERVVKLTVQDTGKGMSEEFIRHRLFKPFSQEDELTPGTGLGLSLVKTMVSQLGGRIRVNSTRGVGTTVTVKLPLEQSSQAAPDEPIAMAEEERLFEQQLRELRGMRVRICGFERNAAAAAHDDDDDDERGIVEGICRDWLQMEVVSDQEGGNSPDVVLRSADTLPDTFAATAQLAKTPNVVVCKDAVAAYQQLSRYERIGQGGVLEFISQPIGPRAFAKSLLLAYQRWMGLSKVVAAVRPKGPSRAQSLYNNAKLLTKASGDHVAAASSPPPPMIRRVYSDAETIPEPRASLADIVSSPPPPPPTADVWLSDEPTPEAEEETQIGTALTTTTTGEEEEEEEEQGHCILLVDDNHINLKVLGAYMDKLGRVHEMVVNGKEAVEAYTARPGQFAAILMDISMPVMDGLEATRRIRAHERAHRLKGVAILALTGLASRSVQHEATDSGVDMFLTKPVRLKALGAALEAMNILTPATSEAGDGDQ